VAALVAWPPEHDRLERAAAQVELLGSVALNLLDGGGPRRADLARRSDPGRSRPGGSPVSFRISRDPSLALARRCRYSLRPFSVPAPAPRATRTRWRPVRRVRRAGGRFRAVAGWPGPGGGYRSGSTPLRTAYLRHQPTEPGTTDWRLSIPGVSDLIVGMSPAHE
jgi:hypothetical protein